MNQPLNPPIKTQLKMPLITQLKIGQRVIDLAEIPDLLQQYQILPQFLKGLVLDEAISTVSLDENEIQSALQNFFQQQQVPTPEAQQAWLQAQNLTLPQLTHLINRSLKIEKFKTQTFSPKIESHFMARKTQLDRVIYSLLRTKDPGIAQEVYFRILEGESTFNELAKTYSEGAEAQTGGVIGPTPLSQPHPTISRILSVSQPGQLWQPIQVDGWFIILRLEQYLPAQLDDATRRRLLDELFEGWLQEQTKTMGDFQVIQSEL